MGIPRKYHIQSGAILCARYLWLRPQFGQRPTSPTPVVRVSNHQMGNKSLCRNTNTYKEEKVVGHHHSNCLIYSPSDFLGRIANIEEMQYPSFQKVLYEYLPILGEWRICFLVANDSGCGFNLTTKSTGNNKKREDWVWRKKQRIPPKYEMGKGFSQLEQVSFRLAQGEDGWWSAKTQVLLFASSGLWEPEKNSCIVYLEENIISSGLTTLFMMEQLDMKWLIAELPVGDKEEREENLETMKPV